jgi:4-cresol dehydrogenase (hydroxylating)
VDFLPDDVVQISAEAFEAALAELTSVLGPEAVLATPQEMAEFRDPFQPAQWKAFWPGVVVQPATLEDVQAVVRLAVRYGIPVWAQGQGRNNGYGGAAPRVSGGITVNFRRMNKVLELDEELGYALLEPGVSFQQLYDEIQPTRPR